jgi:hypothetical protein
VRVRTNPFSRPPPILRIKHHRALSAFSADGQKGLGDEDVPELCLLDPDGDIVAHVIAELKAGCLAGWAC